jgi:hypothetical protein
LKKNVNVEDPTSRNENLVFVSKYEEECNESLPFTNLKYLWKKDPLITFLDIDRFYKEMMKDDEIFHGLLALNPKDRWSADELLKKLGYNPDEYNLIGDNLPDITFQESPKKTGFSPNVIPIFKRVYEKINFNIFYNRFESVDDFDKIMRTDVNNIQFEFDSFKRYNYDILPKFFDPIFFKQQAEKRNPLSRRFQWMYDYAIANRQYFTPVSLSSSSFSLYSFFSSFFSNSFL